MLTLSQSSVFVLLKHLSHHAPPPAWLTDLGMTMKMKVKRRMNCRADRFVWTLSLLLDWSAGSMMTGGEAQTDGDKCPDLYAHTHTQHAHTQEVVCRFDQSTANSVQGCVVCSVVSSHLCEGCCYWKLVRVPLWPTLYTNWMNTHPLAHTVFPVPFQTSAFALLIVVSVCEVCVIPSTVAVVDKLTVSNARTHIWNITMTWKCVTWSRWTTEHREVFVWLVDWLIGWLIEWLILAFYVDIKLKPKSLCISLKTVYIYTYINR